MSKKNFASDRVSLPRQGVRTDRWQLTLLVICILASMASGVGAFVYLSATHPTPNRVSWKLEPPKRASVPYVAAPANLEAAERHSRRQLREM